MFYLLFDVLIFNVRYFSKCSKKPAFTFVYYQKRYQHQNVLRILKVKVFIMQKNIYIVYIYIMCICSHIYLCMYIYIYIMCICSHIYLCIYIYTCVYIYTHVYTHIPYTHMMFNTNASCCRVRCVAQRDPQHNTTRTRACALSHMRAHPYTERREAPAVAEAQRGAEAALHQN